MAKILIIDDDLQINNFLVEIVERSNHCCTSALTASEGLKQLAADAYDVVFLDVRLPDGDGLQLFPQIRKMDPNPEVIILTGFGDPDEAENAIKNGASDYIEKPASAKRILLSLTRALQYQEEKKSRRRPIRLKRDGIVGRSPAITQCLDLLAYAASAEANVLITGETGTGKELFACALHENSNRADRNFVVVDCTALPHTLVESLLFGHQKGAYTGADKTQDGLIKQADGGTLFLDEVGELPLSIQKSFLRVLQERKYRPVGAPQEQTSDFRLIAATNRNLEAMVERGEFREDLLFRIRAMSLNLPPLRAHLEDIKPLVIDYLTRACLRYRTELKGFSPDFIATLMRYDWPGNVRELNQALEQAMASAGPERILFPEDLPTSIRVKLARNSVAPQQVVAPSPDPQELIRLPENLPPLKEFRNQIIDEAQRMYCLKLLEITGGSKQQACQISGLSRSRLYSLLKQYDIPLRHSALPAVKN